MEPLKATYKIVLHLITILKYVTLDITLKNRSFDRFSWDIFSEHKENIFTSSIHNSNEVTSNDVRRRLRSNRPEMQSCL